MGRLVEGVWHKGGYDTAKTGGRFERESSRFRSVVTGDGASGFKAETGRYHLYVALACPWAHRTLIVRKLKKLEAAVSVAVVDSVMGEDGWTLGEGADPVNGARFLRDLYTQANPRYTGRVTVPVLWDKRQGTIVNNESSEIVRMFNRGFDPFGDPSLDLYPPALRGEIDGVNEIVYGTVNNGVYRAGFATSQAAYEEAFTALFDTLDDLDSRLAGSRYLVGDRLTEADWRLFPTLVRFDSVYHGLFKCNQRRVMDYPNLWPYTRELHQVPGIAETVNIGEIKRHYYGSLRMLNPSGVVPKGPEIDFSIPHGRGGRKSP